jgi:hypothetical protein
MVGGGRWWSVVVGGGRRRWSSRRRRRWMTRGTMRDGGGGIIISVSGRAITGQTGGSGPGISAKSLRTRSPPLPLSGPTAISQKRYYDECAKVEPYANVADGGIVRLLHVPRGGRSRKMAANEALSGDACRRWDFASLSGPGWPARTYEP